VNPYQQFAAGVNLSNKQYANGWHDARANLPKNPPPDPEGVLPFDPATALDYFLGYDAGST
jgi:hypothetical protein